jgi:hypothetical protein
LWKVSMCQGGGGVFQPLQHLPENWRT